VLRDQKIGQLTLELDKPELTAEERDFVEAVTTQASIALENVRLLERNQRQASYERLLSDFSRKVRSSTDLDQILRVALRELGQVLRASDGIIRLEMPVEGEEVQS
jgi:GAF domain-containing protein